MIVEMQKKQSQIRYDVQDTAQEWERKAIDRGISDHNFNLANEGRIPCYVFARTEEDALIGGLYAVKINDGLYIKQVWVDNNHRGNGIGAELMDKAEIEAIEEGCQEIWVDTLSYQAPEFYKKLGYKETGRIEGYRYPYDRIFFRKDI